MRVRRASAIPRSNDRKMRRRPWRLRQPAPAKTRMGCGGTPARITLIPPSFNREFDPDWFKANADLYGLNRVSYDRLSVDADYTPVDRVNLYAFYGRENNKPQK